MNFSSCEDRRRLSDIVNRAVIDDPRKISLVIDRLAIFVPVGDRAFAGKQALCDIISSAIGRDHGQLALVVDRLGAIDGESAQADLSRSNLADAIDRAFVNGSARSLSDEQLGGLIDVLYKIKGGKEESKSARNSLSSAIARAVAGNAAQIALVVDRAVAIEGNTPDADLSRASLAKAIDSTLESNPGRYFNDKQTEDLVILYGAIERRSPEAARAKQFLSGVIARILQITVIIERPARRSMVKGSGSTEDLVAAMRQRFI